jgi:hypothetical protein
MYEGMVGLDSWLIQITMGKLHHVGNIQKKPSPDAKVKLLKAELLHLTVYNDYYHYYFKGEYFVIVGPK